MRVENQRGKGWTIEEHETWGYEGFLETAPFVLKKKKTQCATY